MTNYNWANVAIQKFSTPVAAVSAVVRNGDKTKILSDVGKKLPKRIFGRGKTLVLALVLIILVAAVVIAALSFFGVRKSGVLPQTSVYKSAEIGKDFTFPIRNGDGEATKGDLKMTITTEEKTNRILIKGTPATSRDGKLFLIINLEFDNPTQNQLGLAPVELIRLVDSSGKRFAPDVHNDKVTVEAISIKKTRVGFVIDQNATGLKLQVGEVSGEKAIFDLPI